MLVCDCIAHLGETTALDAAHLELRSAGGWKILGLHCYGGAPPTSVAVKNAFCTTLVDCYIESFRNTGILMESVLSNIAIRNVHFITGQAEDGAAMVEMSTPSQDEAMAFAEDLFCQHDMPKRLSMIQSNEQLHRIVLKRWHSSGPYRHLVS